MDTISDRRLLENLHTELHEVTHAAAASFVGFSILRVSVREQRTIVNFPFGPERLQGVYNVRPQVAQEIMNGAITTIMAPYVWPKSRTGAFGKGDEDELNEWAEAWEAIQPRPWALAPTPFEVLASLTHKRLQIWLAHREAKKALVGLALELSLTTSWGVNEWNSVWHSPSCLALRPESYGRVMRRGA